MKKCPCTSETSYAHLQCVHKNYKNHGECHPRGVRGVHYTIYMYLVGRVYSKQAEKMTQSSTTCKFYEKYKKISTFPL
jgi:hypothetical protein